MDFTQKTIDILSKSVKRAPLNQKILARPPFKYLHDITSELISNTGFAKGLFTQDELISDNVKDKESKVAFLTKIIDCVAISTGVRIKANPLKIVAGLEPEATNAFLQLFGKAAVKRVLYSTYLFRSTRQKQSERFFKGNISRTLQLFNISEKLNSNTSLNMSANSLANDEPSPTEISPGPSASNSPKREEPPQSLYSEKVERPNTGRQRNRSRELDLSNQESTESIVVKERQSSVVPEPPVVEKEIKRSVPVPEPIAVPTPRSQPAPTVVSAIEPEPTIEPENEVPKSRIRPTTARMAPPRIKKDVDVVEAIPKYYTLQRLIQDHSQYQILKMMKILSSFKMITKW
jgi:TRAF3-interacting protein 1